MMRALKAEFRKLLTVRSTYFIVLFAVLLDAVIAFFVNGYNLKGMSLMNPLQISSGLYGAANSALFAGIAAIVLTTQEYRFGTILYTLTASKSRSTILIAKAVVITVYALLLTALLMLVSAGAAYAGVAAHGNSLVTQSIPYSNILWRIFYYGWGYGAAGLILAVLIRNLAGALAVLLVLPILIEPLLSQLIKSKAVYLPFTAQSQVIGDSAVAGARLSPGKAAVVFGTYLLVGWIVAWILFVKRDAN